MPSIGVAKPSSLKDIEGSGTLDIGDGTATGTRLAEVDDAELGQAIQWLLGDVYIAPSGTEQVLNADEWPGIPYLRANKIAVSGIGTFCATSREWEEGISYEKWKLSISYKTAEYNEEDDESDGGPEDATHLIQSLDYGVEILSVPMKIGSSSTPLADRKDAVRHIRLPTIIYQATIPKVRRPDWNAVRTKVGCVNSDIIFGGAVGTVLFDGPHAEREIKIFSKPFWKVSYKLIYNKHGWNKQLNPDSLLWEDAWDKAAGTTPPYESAALRPLLGLR